MYFYAIWYSRVLTLYIKRTSDEKKKLRSILHSRKSLLLQIYRLKSNGGLDFDVMMSSFDRADICELVRFSFWHIIAEQYRRNIIDLYRDHDLACLKNIDITYKERFIVMFKRKCKLIISIETILKFEMWLSI